MSDFVDEQIDADMSPELAPGAEIDARNVEEAASMAREELVFQRALGGYPRVTSR